MPRSLQRYHPKREQWLEKIEEQLSNGEFPSQQDLERLLAVECFEDVWKQLRGRIAGKLTAQALTRAMAGSDKVLMFMLEASSAEIFDGAVRAANVENQGNWLNTLLQSKIDLVNASKADPLAIDTEAVEITPRIPYKKNEGDE